MGEFVDAWPHGFSRDGPSWPGIISNVVRVSDGYLYRVEFDDGDNSHGRGVDLPASRVESSFTHNLDQAELITLGSIMANTVEESTERSTVPEAAHKLWIQYLLTHGLTREDWAMEGYTAELWIRRLLLFYSWLHTRGDNVQKMHRSLRLYSIQSYLITGSEYFKHPIFTEFFKGLIKVNCSQRARNIKKFINRKLAAPMELYAAARLSFWDPFATLSPGRARSMSYLVVMLIYSSLYRISQLRKDRCR